MTEKRAERRVLELRKQLVLTAGNRENHRRPGTHRPIECVVGRGVAGVQADDEIDAGELLVARDVAHLETKPVGAERAGERLTMVDDLGLQVEADDVDLAVVHGRQQVVQCEGEVRLAGAEVDDPQPAGRERRKHVLDELQEAVHLPELVVALRPHLARRRHHAELDEERDGRALGQEAPLDPVVGQAGRGPARRPPQDPRLLPSGEDLPVRIGRLEQALPELGAQQLHEPFDGRLRRQVLVGRAGPLVHGEAITQHAADRDGRHGHARRP